jgi:hypothetical protein
MKAYLLEFYSKRSLKIWNCLIKKDCLVCFIQAPTGEIDRYENHSVDQTPLGYMVK